MGSERKSKKRRSPSITDSEGEGRSSKRRSRDEKERSSGSSGRREKKEKRKSKKSHKHSKHSHRSDKGDESEDKHSHKRRKHSHQSEFQELSNDDYFSKNNEFSTWLKEERGLFFSDLSSEGARELFLSFIKVWNNQKLESRYYEGITTGPRSAHNWKIKIEK